MRGTPWRFVACFGLLLFFLAQAASAGDKAFDTLKAEAEALYAKKSYARAHALYLQAAAGKPEGERGRWLAFRLADTRWRAAAASNNPDPSEIEEAKRSLEIQVRDILQKENEDRIFAEVHESLADYWWMRPQAKNWSAAWQHYQKALDWWAGASDIDLARDRYLGMVWNMTRPPWRGPHEYYGYYGNFLPLEVVENTVKIATGKADQARAQYLLALSLKNQGAQNPGRVTRAFEAAINGAEKTDWRDDALFNYAEWLASFGQVIILDNGQERRAPDFNKALAVYRRLLKEYRKGETRYYDQAKSRIESITGPSLSVSVSNIFMPGSEVLAHFNFRNLERFDWALYAVDLTEDARFTNDDNQNAWLNSIAIRGREKAVSGGEATGDTGEHRPGNKSVSIAGDLPPGAYVLEATGGGQRARELVLVTGSTLVLKTTPTQALLYFADAKDGRPEAGAQVSLWERYYDGRKWRWRDHGGKTDDDGLAVFPLTGQARHRQIYAAARLGMNQAFATGNAYQPRVHHEAWRLYVSTDRPAYRPGEKAQWKVVARTYDQSVYATPANQTLAYEIRDLRGSKMREGNIKLNAFGSAWDSVELSGTLPLGAYQVNFWTANKKEHIGSATLFRLEEYKLPEFRVQVETPEDNGRRKTFRLGEEVEVGIQADYYSGGAVPGATVLAVVYQKPFSPIWRPEPDYPWYYRDMFPPGGFGGQGQQVKRETLTTDLNGRATLTFDTPEGGGDMEYIIEARVTDASRREVVARDTVRVTRQSHHVHLLPAHKLYQPQDKVALSVKALDANNQPVQAEGLVRVTRDFWFEIWIDPDGREIKGETLEQLRRQDAVFPPPPAPGGKPWQLKFRGYQHDEILTRPLKTDAEGNAETSFTPDREGYYRIAWQGGEEPYPVESETSVWVATGKTAELGYRHGGLEILVDKDTLRSGETAPVMISSPVSGGYVLFSVEADDLYSYQLVRLKGSVKLLEVPIDERHVPNVFLGAAMVSNRQLYLDQKQVVVPPEKNFLTVEMTADRETYEPGEKGRLTVTTRDHEGRPVPAEVGLGVSDLAVYAIQEDLAPDPREFFFGGKRQLATQTGNTFQIKSYFRLARNEEGRLVDDLKGGGQPRAIGGEVRAYGPKKSAEFSDLNARMSMGQVASAPAESEAMSADRADAFAEGGGAGDAVTVRSDFRSTLLWRPDVVTGEDGRAEVEVLFADSLTEWRATARVNTAGNRFGFATAHVRTSKPLIARLQAPRFFVVGDTLTVSAVLNNNSEKELIVAATLDAQGLELPRVRTRKVTLPAKGMKRVDWPVTVKQAGEARLTLTAKGKPYSDGMEKIFPVYEHGIEKFIAQSGKMTGDDETVTFTLPKERKPESTTMTVRVTPSLAVTMLDALPYLIDFPYGCTEQTLSRFLPAVIVRKTLVNLGLNAGDVEGVLFGGIDEGQTSKTHSKGRKDLGKLDLMVKEGLNRLYDFQHGDGGWGWWKEGESDHFMSAYVLWGLALASESGIEVDPGVTSRAERYLLEELVEEEEAPDRQAWMLNALAVHASLNKRAPHKFEQQALENLWQRRDELNAYSRALTALSAHHFGDRDKARTLVANLENGVIRDEAPGASALLPGAKTAHPGTAHWGEDGLFWRWSDGGVEATAFALRALLAIAPGHELIEPVSLWLIKNRRGAHWKNTRDTAIALFSLNDYLKTSGELSTRADFEVFVNERSVARMQIDDPLRGLRNFGVDPGLLKEGENSLRLVRRSGEGALYYSGEVEFFSQEEPIPAAGNEIFVRREYFKLNARPTLLKGHVYDRVRLSDGDMLKSGERVEVVLTVEAKNHYEYLVFEDLKPAGLEVVALKSGEAMSVKELKRNAVENRIAGEGAKSTASEATLIPPHPPADEQSDYTGRTRWVYQELRDRKVALFIDQLPEGVWEMRYTLRAETPGHFHALPVLGHAMYIPEIRANGRELRMRIEDQEK